MPSKSNEVWALGAAYEPFIGRWSRKVAGEFVTWLAVPPARRWLDVGCGTGALSRTLLDRAAPRLVQGIDSSPAFVAYSRAQIPDGSAAFAVGNAGALPLTAASFDVAVAGLVLNFVPDAAAAVGEMRRVVRDGGVLGAYVWDYAGQMQLLRHFWDAAAALDPAAVTLDEGRRFPLCRPDPLAELFAAAGLSGVQVRAIDVGTTFRDFEDYWAPFLGGQGPAPGYAMSLSDSQRAKLRDLLHAGLPIAADGSIALIARAWAVQGRR